MNWILIAVIVIIAVLGWLGMKKGLIKMVFSLVSTIAALLIAMLFSPVVSGMMKSNEAIVGFFDEKIGAIVDFSPEEAKEETESKQESLIESLPLPETFKDTLCRQITNVIINAIAFVITLVLAIIALALLCKTLDLLAKLPVLRQINTIAGLAAGIAEGVLLVWVLFAILTMFAGSEFGKDALAMIGENPLLDFLYKNNLVSKYIARG